jgi:hypothetical protein
MTTFVLRVYAQTIFYQENLAFCFQLCTVTHLVGFLPLPWFSFSLFFSLTAESDLVDFCLMYGEEVGGLYLFVCKTKSH